MKMRHYDVPSGRKPEAIDRCRTARLAADRALGLERYWIRPAAETVTRTKFPAGPVTLNCPPGDAPPSGVNTGGTVLTVTTTLF